MTCLGITYRAGWTKHNKLTMIPRMFAWLGVIWLFGCYASGPRVILVTARAGTRAEPVQIAEDVQVRIFVPLQDGTLVESSNRVRLPAGGWYFESDPKP